MSLVAHCKCLVARRVSCLNLDPSTPQLGFQYDSSLDGKSEVFAFKFSCPQLTRHLGGFTSPETGMAPGARRALLDVPTPRAASRGRARKSLPLPDFRRPRRGVSAGPGRLVRARGRAPRAGRGRRERGGGAEGWRGVRGGGEGRGVPSRSGARGRARCPGETRLGTAFEIPILEGPRGWLPPLGPTPVPAGGGGAAAVFSEPGAGPCAFLPFPSFPGRQ